MLFLKSLVSLLFFLLRFYILTIFFVSSLALAGVNNFLASDGMQVRPLFTHRRNDSELESSGAGESLEHCIKQQEHEDECGIDHVHESPGEAVPGRVVLAEFPPPDLEKKSQLNAPRRSALGSYILCQFLNSLVFFPSFNTKCVLTEPEICSRGYPN